MLVMLVGCGDAERRERDMVARIEAPGGALVLDRRVVRDIAAREGLSEDEAQARALDRLRLVAARRAELDERETPPEQPDDLDPHRREHLERAAMVRLWLREVFEPAHTAAKIPRRVVEQNMNDARMTQRLFHPELWFICQVLIVPSETDADGRNVAPPSEGDAAERWHAAARQNFAPLAARIEHVAEDLVGDIECATLANIVGASERDFASDSGPMSVRFERFAFAPSEAQSFDQAWVARVTERDEARVVGPFASQFGVHLVLVSKIEPESLAEGSQPPKQLAAARETELRASIELAWQTAQLQRHLAEARERRIVRVGSALD